jgi:hypothetical protein
VSFASLRVRLLVAAAISIILALALAAAGLAWLFERHVERWIDSGLEADLNQLVGGLRRSPAGQIEIGRMPSDPRFEQPLSGLYWQVAIEPKGPVLRSRSLCRTPRLTTPCTRAGCPALVARRFTFFSSMFRFQ